MNYEKISKKAIGCMYVAAGIEVLISIGIIMVFNIWIVPNDLPVIHYILITLSLLLLLYWLISPLLRYKRYYYIINNESIVVKEGFIWINKKVVPIERLHIISINNGPIDRIFGLSKVVVTTAGGDVNIKFLENEKANAIADTLKLRINNIVVKESDTQHEGE